MNTEYFAISEKLGQEISRHRRCAKLTQLELASILGMASSQLCKLEKGKNLPNVQTLSRIEQALNLPEKTLVNIRTALAIQTIDGNDYLKNLKEAQRPLTFSIPSRFVEIKRVDSLAELNSKLIEEIEPLVDRYAELDLQLGQESSLRINCFDQLLGVGEGDATTLAHVIRNSLGLGSAPLTGFLPLLESQNVRVVFSSHLNGTVHAKSFVDNRHQNLIVCLYERSTPERQLTDLAQEIAYACLFFRNRMMPVRDTRENLHFARSFARSLLIPRPGLKSLIEMLDIRRDSWTIPLICQLKWRFGVSAQLFLFQLQALNQIEPALFSSLQDKLSVHYRETAVRYGKDTDEYLAHIEPLPCLPPLIRNAWLSALEIRAKS